MNDFLGIEVMRLIIHICMFLFFAFMTFQAAKFLWLSIREKIWPMIPFFMLATGMLVTAMYSLSIYIIDTFILKQPSF